MGKLNRKVLVLNSTYEPLDILKARDVLRKIYAGSVSFYVEKYYNDSYLHNNTLEVKIPSVIRLCNYVNIKRSLRVAAGKRSRIFQRDQYRCVYCGYQGTNKELTLDHFIPKSRGGDSSSHNLITACFPCNNKKGDRMPEEIGIKINKGVLRTNIDLSLLIAEARNITDWHPYLYI